MLDCLKSTGDEVTLVRQAAAFSVINMKDNVDVVYRYDSVFRIRVTAGQHLIDGVITELEGNTLYIRNENRCNWVRSFKNKYTVEISAPSVEKVLSYGSGDFRSIDTITSPRFTFESWNGSGSIKLLLRSDESTLINHIGRTDITASGTSRVSFVTINDTGVLDASGLVTDHCYIRSNSTGRCTVNARYEIGAEINSIGDIYYYGRPSTINRTITGQGQLIAVQ